MTYDWNKMVEITVPVGINGWVYAGSVTINGVTVDFPIGVPTTVPEPVAELLKKFIALEEDKNKVPEQGAGGSGSLTVNATITTMSDDNLTGYATFDKTFAETLAAVKAGRYVTCRVDFGDGVVLIVPACGYKNDFVEFMLAVNGARLKVQYFEEYEEGPVEITPPAS